METQTAQKKHKPVVNPVKRSRNQLHEGQHANVQSILHGSRTQPKLRVGQPNDRYEQEADRVADQVMRMPVRPHSYRISNEPIIQRRCDKCEDEALIQTKTNANVTPEVTPSIATSIQSLQGGGQPLSKQERGFFEPRIGADFSNVRVHNDTKAAGTARSVNARAFTYGHHVVFGVGEYSPNTAQGRKLLAHELTHVVQQQSGIKPRMQRHVLENDQSTAPAMNCPIALTSASDYLFTINFNLGGATLSQNDKEVLAGFATEWNLSPVQPIVRVDGFASKDGGPNDNWPLSCRRAMAVASELNAPSIGGKPGVSAGSIEFFANGETEFFSSSNLAPNRVSSINAPGMTMPTSREPSVFSWAASTSGTTAGDNCCAKCPVGLGVDCDPPKFKNGIELTANIRDHDPTFSYDIKRIKEINYFRKEEWPMGLTGPWETINAWNKPAGSDDDSHDTDECLVPIANRSTHKIYSEDRPGFKLSNFSNAYNAYIQIANFTEFVRVIRSDGTTYDDSRIQKWHSKNLVEKSAGTWSMNTAESEIDTGHLTSLRP